MATPIEDYGQDAPTATKAVSPEQELTQLRNEHRRLLEENTKRRAELVAMLREDSKRLHSDNREMEAFRQWLLAIRPRDVPVPIHPGGEYGMPRSMAAEMGELAREKARLGSMYPVHY
jgi:hypothetical protein